MVDGVTTAPERPTRRVARVVTGGQSGVDRAATDVAIACGVAYGGWVPRGGWAEDHEEPPGVLVAYPGFTPTDATDPAVRSRRNVEDADATLVLVSGTSRSPGTELTRRLAEAAGSPLAVVDLRAPRAGELLEAFAATLPRGCTLNVAGPREREEPGAYAAARSFLEQHRGVLFGR